MIDASNPNYLETLRQIDELRAVAAKIESNLHSQVPHGLSEKFVSSRMIMMKWVEEIEFTLADYIR